MKQIGVDFIDILFGFVVTEVFTAFTIVRGSEYASWANLALALAVIVFSWLGYHKAKEIYSRTISFGDSSIVQFLIDIGIVALYLALVKQDEHTLSVARLAPHHVLSIRPEAVTLAAIFALYLAWDILQIRLSDRDRRTAAVDHTWWSLLFMILLGGYSAIVIWPWRPTGNGSILATNAIYLVLIYLYRVKLPAAEPAETEAAEI